MNYKFWYFDNLAKTTKNEDLLLYLQVMEAGIQSQ